MVPSAAAPRSQAESFAVKVSRLAGCERMPLVPWAMIVEFPVDALVAAEKSTGVLEPAATLKGFGGFERTPAGRPVRETWTVPVKPLSGLTDSFTAWLVAPCWTLTEFAENAMEKSGWGGGRGGGG